MAKNSKQHIDINMDKVIGKTLNKIGLLWRNQARVNMDTISRGVKRGNHIASKRGDSPNNETGELRKTLRYQRYRNILRVGGGNAKINYLKYLEGEGLNRPNVIKSIRQNKTEIESVLGKSILDNVRVRRA